MENLNVIASVEGDEAIRNPQSSIVVFILIAVQSPIA